MVDKLTKDKETGIWHGTDVGYDFNKKEFYDIPTGWHLKQNGVWEVWKDETLYHYCTSEADIKDAGCKLVVYATQNLKPHTCFPQ
jgi:hypothetical protein